MQIYLGITGIFSLSYFLVLRIYTGKWNSTFARFWLLFGTIHIVLLPMGRILWIRNGLTAVFAGMWICFFLLGGCIWLGGGQRSVRECRYLIVLGAQVRGTRITNSLQRRLDAAIAYKKRYPKVLVIVSGGQGEDEEISEACAMARYLQEHQIRSEEILQEDQSKTIRENLQFSAQYVSDLQDPVGIVTNNFHVFRALLLARREGYENVVGIAVGCNQVLFLHYLVREIFAVIWMWFRNRILQRRKKSG